MFGFGVSSTKNTHFRWETYRQDIKYIQKESDYRKFQINISSKKKWNTSKFVINYVKTTTYVK